MDIRSIIDADDAPSARKPSAPGPVYHDHKHRPAGYPNPQQAQTPTHQERRDGRPPQPSPLQTTGRSEYWANGPSRGAIQSPHQQPPPSALNSGQYAPPQMPSQSPVHGPVHGPQCSQRENYPSSGAPFNRSFGSSTPLSQTPTTSTPGSAHGYSSLGRPSSSHSIPTPSSTHQPSSYFRESPQASHTHLRTLSQSQTGSQYMSQPSTPLGPPATFPRPSFSLRRGSPGTYNREQILPGGTYGQPQAISPSPATARSPQIYGVRHSQSIGHEPIILSERESSLSVSPKTRLPNLTSINSSEMPSSEAGPWNRQVKPAKRIVETICLSPDLASVRESTMDSTQSTISRTSSIGVTGLLNAAPTIEPLERVNHHSHSEISSTLDTESKIPPPDYVPRNHKSFAPYRENLPSVPQRPSNAKMPPFVKVEASAQKDSPTKSTKKRAYDQSSTDKESKRPKDAEEIASTPNEMPIASQPAKKKVRLGDSVNNPMPISTEPIDVNQPINAADSTLGFKPSAEKKQRPSRWKEVPIWAQSVLRHNRPPNGNPRRAAPKQAAIVSASAQSNGQPNGMQGANGHSNQANGVHVPVAQPNLANTGPLGPWEPSFVNVIPAEELVRIISDWLFPNVVQRDDVGVGPAGGGTGGGAVLEIEAKIGQLIDKNTNDRLRLPVLNECVVSHTDPNIRIAFKSSMTEVGTWVWARF